MVDYAVDVRYDSDRLPGQSTGWPADDNFDELKILAFAALQAAEEEQEVAILLSQVARMRNAVSGRAPSSPASSSTRAVKEGTETPRPKTTRSGRSVKRKRSFWLDDEEYDMRHQNSTRKGKISATREAEKGKNEYKS